MIAFGLITQIFPTSIWTGVLNDINNADIKKEISRIEGLVPESIKREYTADENNGWDCNMNSSIGYESNFLNIPISSIEMLKLSITEVVANYVKQLELGNRVELAESFYNIGKPGTFQEFHNHNPRHLSCVYYVDAHEDSGDLVLVDSRFAERKRIPPITSGLRVFPSYINHQVNLNETESTRISMSCNFIIL
jgi:hypothetical protein